MPVIRPLTGPKTATAWPKAACIFQRIFLASAGVAAAASANAQSAAVATWRVKRRLLMVKTSL